MSPSVTVDGSPRATTPHGACTLTGRYTSPRESSMVKSADATRHRILEAAYELFYRKGFVRVGVDAVAAAACVTKRTLYYHFRSKDALLEAVLAFHHELALARIGRWSELLPARPAGML